METGVDLNLEQHFESLFLKVKITWKIGIEIIFTEITSKFQTITKKRQVIELNMKFWSRKTEMVVLLTTCVW